MANDKHNYFFGNNKLKKINVKKEKESIRNSAIALPKRRKMVLLKAEYFHYTLNLTQNNQSNQSNQAIRISRKGGEIKVRIRETVELRNNELFFLLVFPFIKALTEFKNIL